MTRFENVWLDTFRPHTNDVLKRFLPPKLRQAPVVMPRSKSIADLIEKTQGRADILNTNVIFMYFDDVYFLVHREAAHRARAGRVLQK